MENVQTLVHKIFNNRLNKDQVPYHDVKLLFETPYSKRVEIKSHRFILSLRSTKFNKLFKENRDLDEFKIRDVEISTFRRMLRYFYCDEIELDYEYLASLIQASTIYNVLGLKTKLIELFNDSLCIENSLIIYDQLLRVKEEEICDYAIFDDVEDLISMHTFLAFKTRHLHNIRKETIIKLLQSNFLFIGEYDLFKAVKRWILLKYDSFDVQCNEFKSIKHLIRFPQMSKDQFEKVRKTEGHLFNEDELEEFNQYYALKTKKGNKKKSVDDGSKKFSVNYNLAKRDESLIVKVNYDNKKKNWIMSNPFKHINDDSSFENFVKYAFRDDNEFASMMRISIGKNYNKDCLTKVKKPRNQPISREKIFLFKMKIFCSEDDHDQGMILEFYKDGKKTNINKSINNYIKNGNHFYSFDPAIELKIGIHYRIVFRNLENTNFGIAFEVEKISKETDEGEMLDIQLKVDDDLTDQYAIGDLFFYYKI